MSISFKKTIDEISIQQAVTFKSQLPTANNKIRDVRYVKEEHAYYIFTGINWQEVELVSE